jgi:hypothetical protein
LFVLLLAGCAVQETRELSKGPERHYTGVIDNTQTTTRGGASKTALMPLMLFGAIGGLIYGAATGDQPTRMHVVRLDSGGIVSVISDDEFSPGDCVRIVVNDAAAEPLSWYAWGQAELHRTGCSLVSQ